MNDGLIVKALIQEIKTQLGIYGIQPADLRVTRSNQPTAQYPGATNGAKPYQVFITPVASTQVGYDRRYSGSDLTLNHVKQASYQISIMTDFDPATMTVMPAHEVAQIINDMIQQPDAIRTLKAAGVDIQSCTDVRPAFEVSESEQWQSMPSFDIVLSYNTQYVKPVPGVTYTDGTLDSV